MRTTAKIFTEAQTQSIDLLAAYDVTEVSASAFRSGMVLVDEFDTPIGILDHRMRIGSDNGRNAGAVRWMVEDLEQGKWVEATFGINKPFRVVAK